MGAVRGCGAEAVDACVNRNRDPLDPNSPSFVVDNYISKMLEKNGVKYAVLLFGLFHFGADYWRRIEELCWKRPTN